MILHGGIQGFSVLLKIQRLAFSHKLKENNEQRDHLMGDLPKKARMRCREIMTGSVTTATSVTSLRDAAILMRDGDMGSVPVVEDGKLVGIITDRDIVVRAVANGLDPSKPIDMAMTAEIYSVRPDDFVFEAIRLMRDHRVRRLPVVNDLGELVGIIAMADIVLEMEDEREIAETLEEISSGSGFWSRN